MESIGSMQRQMRVCAVALIVIVTGWAQPSPGEERTPCDPDAVVGSVDSGWRVQVDPETGTYSLPAPETLAAPASGARAARAVVVTPGTSAAGGYMIRFGDHAPDLEQQ